MRRSDRSSNRYDEPGPSMEMRSQSIDPTRASAQTLNSEYGRTSIENFRRNVQTFRHPRSMHRNKNVFDAIKGLPSRRVTHFDASGSAMLEYDQDHFDNDEYDDDEYEHTDNEVEQFVHQFEHNEELMEDTPDGEAMRIEALREIPQSLSTKRNIRIKLSATVSRKSKRHPISFAKRTKYRLSLWWKKTKQSMRDILFSLEFGYDTIKNIEGHFGSGAATYFRFLRWLCIMNIFVSILTISFIVVPQSLFTEHNQNLPVETFSFWDIFTGQGSFTNSTLYYGYYADSAMSLIEGHYYSIPHAYFLAMVAVYVFMLILISLSMARSYRENFIETSGELKNIFANKVFCGWQFSITTQEAADLRSKSFYNNIKELLSEADNVSEKKDAFERFYLFTVKLFINAFVLSLIGASGYVMWLLMDGSIDLIKEETTPGESMLTAFIVTLIMYTLPLFFSWIIKYERYHNPRTVLNITLARTFILEGVLVSILCIFWLQSKNRCWETLLGQEVYRLIMVDFLFAIIVLPICELLRKLIAKYVWPDLGLPEFAIARNTLGLIYNQTLMWMGLFYSPLIVAVVAIKMIVQFNFRHLTTLLNCQPSTRTWRATQTQTVFLFLVFVSLLCIIMAFGYSFVSVDTGNCGPFQKQEFIYLAFLNVILNLKEDSVFFTIILYVTKPGVIAFILIAMSVGVYYLQAKSISNKMKVSQLRDILISQAKDKEFLLRAISNVSEGRWIYDYKSQTLGVDDMNNKKSVDYKQRSSANSSYQFSPRHHQY